MTHLNKVAFNLDRDGSFLLDCPVNVSKIELIFYFIEIPLIVTYCLRSITPSKSCAVMTPPIAPSPVQWRSVCGLHRRDICFLSIGADSLEDVFSECVVCMFLEAVCVCVWIGANPPAFMHEEGGGGKERRHENERDAKRYRKERMLMHEPALVLSLEEQWGMKSVLKLNANITQTGI